jgi:Prokaryotic Cytochrome C oxidase subunit IV
MKRRHGYRAGCTPIVCGVNTRYRKAGVPVRTTVIWVGLVLATCLTLWLGTSHSAAQQGVRIAVALAIPVTFLKVYFIGSEFMEPRGAPAALRGGFTAWVVIVAAAVTSLYLL